MVNYPYAVDRLNSSTICGRELVGANEQSKPEMTGVTETDGAVDRLGDAEEEAVGGSLSAVVAWFRPCSEELEWPEFFRTDGRQCRDLETIGRYEFGTSLRESTPFLAQDLLKEGEAIS